MTRLIGTAFDVALDEARAAGSARVPCQNSTLQP